MMGNDALFGKRLPFAEHLEAERKSMMDLAQNAFVAAQKHYHDMMVLAAGILGVVVPVLYAQGPALINPWFIRRAAVCLGGVVAFGVVLQFVSKWLQNSAMATMMRYYVSRSAMLADVDETEEAFSVAMESALRDYSAAINKYKYVKPLAIVGDVLFYGAFLRGIAYIVEGFVLK